MLKIVTDELLEHIEAVIEFKKANMGVPVDPRSLDIVKHG